MTHRLRSKRHPTPGQRRLLVERLEPRLALAAEPLLVQGTGGDDGIFIDPVSGSPGQVMVTRNGVTTGPFFPLGPIVVEGLGGNDTLAVHPDVMLPARLDGGPGSDTLQGGSGDDQIASRDGSADIVAGGLGIDRAATDSLDTVTGIEHLNPIPLTPDNQTQRIKVLVLNFDPLVPSEGNQRLYEIFGWSNPRNLAAGYEADLERASGGAVEFEIVDWRDINEIPAFVDGFRYTTEDYVQHRRTGTGWHTGPADWPRIVSEQNIVPLIDSGDVDEVWLFGDHFFELLGESFMSGPGAFFINGPTFPQIPTQRAFASYGFSYERGVAEMLHNTGHRTEATLNRIYGGWNLANPTSNWDRFSANYNQSNGVAGVGTTHWPANAEGDYDTGNPRIVQSWADDYLNYPNLTGATTPISRSSWNKGSPFNYERDYQNWYFGHLPRAAGVNPDGKQNNWWKYLHDFNNYTASGQPKPLSAAALVNDIFNLGGATHTFTIAYSGAVPVDLSSLDSGDLRVTGPGGFDVSAQLVGLSDNTSDTHIVATYRINAPGGTWDGPDFGDYRVLLQGSQVRNLAGTFLAANQVGGFSVRAGATALPLTSDADTSLLLRFDGSASGTSGEVPTGSLPANYETGRLGQAAKFSAGEQAIFPVAGNINPLAGTVEFWIKPTWPGNDPGVHTILSVGNGLSNAMHILTDGWHPGFKVIMTGDNPATPQVETDYESNRFQAALTNTWQAGQWHHVAASWDSQAQFIRMYFDGQLVADWAGCPVINTFSTTDFWIGSFPGGGSPALATLDELRISTRARTSSEIRGDYNAGWAAVDLALDASTVNVPLGASRALRATATDASGAARNVTALVAWSSSDPAVASVSPTGVVTALASGAATITAQFDTLTATATVSVPVLNSPRGVFTASDVTAHGGGEYQVSVTFSDDVSVDVSTLGLGDLRVDSPSGFSAFLTLAAPVAGGNGSPRTALYRFTPPGGFWDERDNGEYTLSLIPNQVHDTSVNLNAQLVTDTFTVAIPPLVEAPTVATPPSASPNPVLGITATLSVLGAHGGGEANLIYTWSVVVKPVGAAEPIFSVNGTNGSKTTLATFSKSGDYQFRVTISDGPLSVSSDLAVAVDIAPAQSKSNQFDVNNDGTVNIVDLIDLIDLIVLHGIGPAPIPLATDNPKLYPDVNGDRNMNLLDLIDIIFYIVDPPDATAAVSTPPSEATTGEPRQASALDDELLAVIASDADAERRRKR